MSCAQIRPVPQYQTSDAAPTLWGVWGGRYNKTQESKGKLDAQQCNTREAKKHGWEVRSGKVSKQRKALRILNSFLSIPTPKERYPSAL